MEGSPDNGEYNEVIANLTACIATYRSCPQSQTSSPVRCPNDSAPATSEAEEVQRLKDDIRNINTKMKERLETIKEQYNVPAVSVNKSCAYEKSSNIKPTIGPKCIAQSKDSRSRSREQKGAITTKESAGTKAKENALVSKEGLGDGDVDVDEATGMGIGRMVVLHKLKGRVQEQEKKIAELLEQNYDLKNQLEKERHEKHQALVELNEMKLQGESRRMAECQDQLEVEARLRVKWL